MNIEYADQNNAEVILPSDITIRYHHFDNWCGSVQGWYGVKEMDIFHIRRGKKNFSDLTYIRSKPWHMPKNSESDQEIRVFCLDQAKELTEYHLKTYHRHDQEILKTDAVKSIMDSIVNHGQESELDDLISSVHTLMSLTEYVYEFNNQKALGGKDANMLWADLSNPDRYDHYSNLISETFHQIAADRKNIELGMEPKEIAAYLNTQEKNLHLFRDQFIHFKNVVLNSSNKDNYLNFLREINFFFQPETRSLLDESMLFEGLKDTRAFMNALEAFHSGSVKRKVYVEDLLGPNPNLEQPLTKLFINQRFIRLYQFFRTAWLDPDKEVIFTLEPDGICKSCRGGESAVGNHCNVRDANEVTADHLTQEAMVHFFNSDDVLNSVKSKVKILTDKTGTPTNIRMPISLYFNLSLMTNLDEEQTKVFLSSSSKDLSE